MKKAIFLLFVFYSSFNAYSQTIEDEDYVLLNEILSKLSTKRNDSIKLYEKSPSFINQETVFTKDFFVSYTYPTLGVDSNKVKILIKKLDFNYLSSQKRKSSEWEFSKIKLPVYKYIENKNDNVSNIKYQRLFGIARPVYSEKGDFAFVYYGYFCGMECGQTGMKIYKKCKGKWVFYVDIPISIS